MDPQQIINGAIESFRRNVTERYFDLKGRVSRQEFWLFVLASFVVFLVAAILNRIIGIITPVVTLALLPPMAGLGARRLQDTDRDGSLVWVLIVPVAIFDVINLLAGLSPYGALGFLWFFFSIGWLLNLVMLVAGVALIYFWVQPGTAGPNKYGPPPSDAVAPPTPAAPAS